MKKTSSASKKTILYLLITLHTFLPVNSLINNTINYTNNTQGVGRFRTEHFIKYLFLKIS